MGRWVLRLGGNGGRRRVLGLGGNGVQEKDRRRVLGLGWSRRYTFWSESWGSMALRSGIEQLG